MENYLLNMFAHIKNGLILKKKYVLQKKKKPCVYYLQVLWDEGFINGYEDNCENYIKIFLKYCEGESVIKNIKILSKPGHRIYYTTKQIWKIDSNKNCIIFSTSKGVMSLTNCKKNNIGGEPVISVS